MRYALRDLSEPIFEKDPGFERFAGRSKYTFFIFLFFKSFDRQKMKILFLTFRK